MILLAKETFIEKQSNTKTLSDNSKLYVEKNTSRSRFNSPNEIVRNENETEFLDNHENNQTNKRLNFFRSSKIHPEEFR